MGRFVLRYQPNLSVLVSSVAAAYDTKDFMFLPDPVALQAWAKLLTTSIRAHIGAGNSISEWRPPHKKPLPRDQETAHLLDCYHVFASSACGQVFLASYCDDRNNSTELRRLPPNAIYLGQRSGRNLFIYCSWSFGRHTWVCLLTTQRSHHGPNTQTRPASGPCLCLDARSFATCVWHLRHRPLTILTRLLTCTTSVFLPRCLPYRKIVAKVHPQLLPIVEARPAKCREDTSNAAITSATQVRDSFHWCARRFSRAVRRFCHCRSRRPQRRRSLAYKIPRITSASQRGSSLSISQLVWTPGQARSGKVLATLQ